MRTFTKITTIALAALATLAICFAMPGAISVWGLHSNFEKSINADKQIDFETLRTLKFDDWQAESRVCPYSKAQFTLSKFLGIPGRYSETLISEDQNGIIFRRNDGQTTLVKFSRQKLDLCNQ
jgi:hypothetical protein